MSLIPYCDGSKEKYDVRGLVLSILGILIGILMMICLISIGIGFYLVKLTDKMITLFPLKITLIFMWATGTIISFILSGINQKTILEAIKLRPQALDLIFGCAENMVLLVSEFGWFSFFRLLFNMIVPGLGTLTLLKKYWCDFCIILASIAQFFGGLFFFVSLGILFKGKCYVDEYEELFFEVLETTQKDSNDYTYFTTVFNYFYTMGLCFYFSGIILIIILDYVEKIRYIQSYIFALA